MMDFFDVCNEADMLIADVLAAEHLLDTICSEYAPSREQYLNSELYERAWTLHGGLERAARRTLEHIRETLQQISTAPHKVTEQS